MTKKLFFALLMSHLCMCWPLLAAVRFAQITDAHLFESPKHAHEAEISNLELGKAIEKINEVSKELTNKGDKPLNFVLLTGDLGIGKLLKLEKAASNKKDIITKDVDQWRKAKKAFAHIISQSTVKTWFFVPGNNDLYEEQHATIGFVKDFITELKEMPEVKEAGVQVVDFRLEALEKVQSTLPPGMYVVDNFLFVGWDNSFFKNNNSFKKFIGADKHWVSSNQTEEYESIKKLSNSIKKVTVPYAYIFYHIPEIDDPYLMTLHKDKQRNKVAMRLEEANLFSPSLSPPSYAYSAWTIPIDIRHIWEELITNKTFQKPVIKGLFAGHFHSHVKEVYENTQWLKSVVYKPEILEKLYLAPPVSVKHQEKYPLSDRAIGGQIVTIHDDGHVAREIFWLK